MKPIDKIIKDNLPGNSIVQAYKANIHGCMEELVLVILWDLHTFNQLDDVLVKRLSVSTGLDCEAICRDNGIVYNIRE